MSQADYFLKVGDLKGESLDTNYKDWIEIQSFSWGATNSGSMGLGSGGGTGKVSMQDFHFTMWQNKVSPELMVRCATGEHYKDATLICRKAGGGDGGASAVEYLKVKFTDVVISSYQTGGGGTGLPIDQVSLNFTKVEVEYTPQDGNGKKLASVKHGYDVKANKKV